MRIGVIGLGRMGRHLARRLVEGGHEVTVYNRTPGKAAALVGAGAREAASVAGACTGREVLISMLADDAALLDVTLGAGGVRDALPPGAIHVVMGTHGVAAIRRVDTAHRDASQQMVAAPVLGRPEVAAAGQLGIVAAGPQPALQACAPLFAMLGRRTFEAGTDPAGACAIKLSNNFVLGCAIEAMGEAFALVRKHGVPAGVLNDVLTDGLFACVAYKTYGRIIADEAYAQAGFTAALGLKDAELILAAAAAAAVPLPSGENLRARLREAIAHGDGAKDWAVVARQQARASGLD